MLSLANRPIEDVIRFFAKYGVEAGYLVPTETGLAKSIMDAHGTLREYLLGVGYHDFNIQAQGPAAKVRRPIKVLTVGGWAEQYVSLYRPETKSGDPRIWITRLSDYAEAGDVVAILHDQGQLYVVNASRGGLLDTARDPSTPLGSLLASLAAPSDVAEELLQRLREIHSEGPLLTVTSGPTGVGMTLERRLGIAPNSRKEPDFKGIELKASRSRKGGRKSVNRITLFSRVPLWRDSPVGTALALLEEHGYRDAFDRLQIYGTLSARPNAQGFYLELDGGSLYASRIVEGRSERLLCWKVEDLKHSLVEKHRETFWVKAVSNGVGANEEFHYVEVAHTTGPLEANVPELLAIGKIELDLVMHRIPAKRVGTFRVRDHGYLFKIRPQDLDMLFPPAKRYQLDRNS
ncbi:MvaI/BcnI family restriction endonuclease [Stenotrophomonas maltophilia]|uniref:MvaI/BcnI family restriction endonuclease n=1 Tax=Stenotrophomonas maltophilia TaxID=40324 RepID=UPI001F5300AD|nr:MvaI/BcnI family restriction endonuclease [Stenotrophomonas maltophilia]MCI1130333.1 MvaI/BcnI family restriction endonuclease [Stenotrophomonas maltophilia]